MPNTVRKHRIPVLPVPEEEPVEVGHPAEAAEKEAAKDGLNLKVENQPTSGCSFTVINKIGQGGYGLVFTVKKNQGVDKNKIYAMKVRTIFFMLSSLTYLEIGVLKNVSKERKL